MTQDVKVNLTRLSVGLGAAAILLGALWTVFSVAVDAREAKAASARAENGVSAAIQAANDAKAAAERHASAARELAAENAKELVKALNEGLTKLNDSMNLATQRIARMEGDVAALLREFQDTKGAVKAMQDGRPPTPPTR